MLLFPFQGLSGTYVLQTSSATTYNSPHAHAASQLACLYIVTYKYYSQWYVVRAWCCLAHVPTYKTCQHFHMSHIYLLVYTCIGNGRRKYTHVYIESKKYCHSRIYFTLIIIRKKDGFIQYIPVNQISIRIYGMKYTYTFPKITQISIFQRTVVVVLSRVF